MNEPDDLRALLRDRADLAPDPDDIVPVTRERAHRRRSRQRTLALAGVVVATVAGLATASLVRFGPPPPAASAPPLTPSLPFTVGHVPPGYQLVGWRVYPHSISIAEYQSGTFGIQVEQVPVDQTSGQRQPTTVQGRPAILVHHTAMPLNSASTQLTWQVGPGRWLLVSGQAPVTEQTVRAVAESVTTKPSKPPSIMRVGHVPAGYTPESWIWTSGGGGTEQLMLCPPPTPYTTGQLTGERNGPFLPSGLGCFNLQLTTFHSTIATEGPNGKPWITNGQFNLSAQIDPLHQLMITAPAAQADEARTVFESVSAG